MKSTASVAYSTARDSFRAGAEMSSRALSSGNMDACTFAFVFASSEHDSTELLKGVRSVLGDQVGLAGGTSSGTITRDYIGYEGFNAGIMVIASGDIIFTAHLIDELKRGEFEAGQRAGKEIAGMHELENPNLLLFYDSVRSDSGAASPFYQATPILAGIESQIETFPATAGVGFATGLDLRKTELWNREQIISDGILPIVISGNIRMDTTIMHGCKPASDYHTITKVAGNLILEIDNRPALDVVGDYHEKVEEVDWKNAMYMITLGVNTGEKYAPFREEDYINRMVLGVDVPSGALVMVEGDLTEGQDCQLMRRCIETDMVADGALKLLDSLEGRKPLFALYISCLGRIKKIFGTEKEEASEIQETIGKKIPLLGIYSGTEIARINGKVMPLDWTGVLCIFSQSE